ncbi:hypothetical protein PspLS_03352 [Pyricularia sp. CBS 133598]|nr:hypothetical protein PspLS_03352 [Pyricularia sp. CBS 133598]
MQPKQLLSIAFVLLASTPALASWLQCPPNIQVACQRDGCVCGSTSTFPTCNTSTDCENRCECRGDSPPPPYPNPNPPPYPNPPAPIPPKNSYRAPQRSGSQRSGSQRSGSRLTTGQRRVAAPAAPRQAAGRGRLRIDLDGLHKLRYDLWLVAKRRLQEFLQLPLNLGHVLTTQSAPRLRLVDQRPPPTGEGVD